MSTERKSTLEERGCCAASVWLLKVLVPHPHSSPHLVPLIIHNSPKNNSTAKAKWHSWQCWVLNAASSLRAHASPVPTSISLYHDSFCNIFCTMSERAKSDRSRAAASNSHPPPAPASAAQEPQQPEEPPILSHLQLLDPILQFLTRATGQSLISLATLRRTLPKDGQAGDKVMNAIRSIPELGRRGILRVAVRQCPAEGGEAPTSTDLPKSEKDDEGMHNNYIFDEDEVYRRYHAALNLSGHEQQTNTCTTTEQDRDQDQLMVGFFPKPGHFNGECIAAAAEAAAKGTKSSADGKGLHGATKTGAKKRMAALRKSLKAEEKQKRKEKQVDKESKTKAKAKAKAVTKRRQRKEPGPSVTVDSDVEPAKDSTGESKGVSEDQVLASTPLNRHNDSPEAKGALDCYRKLMGIKDTKKDGDSNKEEDGPEPLMLPGQTVYAGCKPAREVRFGTLSEETRKLIPSALAEAFGLDIGGSDAAHGQSQIRRRLYYHQAAAVESILNGHHTTICTGTGSGKSLCFLLPVLSMVMKTDIDAVTASAFSSSNDEVIGGAAAIIMFPTKALAQDQYTKLMGLINSHPLLVDHIRVGVIDGDTPHSSRADIIKHSNIVLTNPDTIHAAILPNWKRTYAPFLAKVRCVVIDESHMYEGAFGAHVSLVLARLVRVCAAAFYKRCDDPTEEQKPITFVGCSATIGRPEEHFRLLCPIAEDDAVKVLSPEDDGSPCESKFFFTHTPPLLDTSGKSTGKLVVPITKKNQKGSSDDVTAQDQGRTRRGSSNRGADLRRAPMHRRHAADETARLLAAAVRNGVRCIAFCKTRSLCEWVYERCISDLRSTASSGNDLAKKVESYRGGYSADARRSIEKRLFKEELLAVVATSALELGVDIGGIDLTLHCGYPGSISSLMQQAGRAGRGGKPSASIMVCFSSPSEQNFWRFPKTLLTNGLDAPPAVPVNAGLLQNHLLCAGEEYSLVMGQNSITTLLTSERHQPVQSQIVDRDLFSGALYDECIEKLLQDRLISAGRVTITDAGGKEETIVTYSTHPSVDKPYSRVSLRSIEHIAYQIVDLNHNLQGGRTDTINENAVLDTIPYSRVFYHAFPGAVIMHRGHRYKVEVMNNPPPFADCSIGYSRSMKLGAFAKQTNVTYMTQALALTHITVVKQFDRVEILAMDVEKSQKSKGGTAATDDLYKHPELNTGAIAGNGVVTVKRTVHGYKRLSPVNRVELSRHELKMPSMEYDTNAVWFDCEASLLGSVMPGFDEGVHALSHALLAVAPLFVPCASSDIDCDHSRHDTTRIMIFDNRAGGAGITSRLWRHFFRPDGVLSSAIELLEHCSTCSDESGFKGGCPGCIQSVPCINFHEDLSRPAGLRIARRLLKRIEQTALYKENAKALHVAKEKEEHGANDDEGNGVNTSTSSGATPDRPTNKVTEDTPRRLARKRALEFAKDLESAKKRSVVVGRPSWPADERS